MENLQISKTLQEICSKNRSKDPQITLWVSPFLRKRLISYFYQEQINSYSTITYEDLWNLTEGQWRSKIEANLITQTRLVLNSQRLIIPRFPINFVMKKLDSEPRLLESKVDIKPYKDYPLLIWFVTNNRDRKCLKIDQKFLTNSIFFWFNITTLERDSTLSTENYRYGKEYYNWKLGALIHFIKKFITSRQVTYSTLFSDEEIIKIADFFFAGDDFPKWLENIPPLTVYNFNAENIAKDVVTYVNRLKYSYFKRRISEREMEALERALSEIVTKQEWVDFVRSHPPKYLNVPMEKRSARAKALFKYWEHVNRYGHIESIKFNKAYVNHFKNELFEYFPQLKKLKFIAQLEGTNGRITS